MGGPSYSVGHVASNIFITLFVVMSFLGDSFPNMMTSIGAPRDSSYDRWNAAGLNRVYGPLLHIKEGCAYEAWWSFFLEVRLLQCWVPNYRGQIANLMAGICWISFFFQEVYIYFVMDVKDLPPSMFFIFGVLWSLIYLHRAYQNFWFSPKGGACLQKYGNILMAWVSVCAVALVASWISIHYQAPKLTANIALYKNISDAFKPVGDIGTWAAGAQYPDGFHPGSFGVAAHKELEALQYMYSPVFFFCLFAIPFGFLSALHFVPSEHDDQDGLLQEEDRE